METIREKRDRLFKEQNHLGMMSDATLWPRWPILPLKKGKDFNTMELGFLHVDHPHVVFKGWIFKRFNDLNSLEKEEYKSFEEIVAAGWIVD